MMNYGIMGGFGFSGIFMFIFWIAFFWLLIWLIFQLTDKNKLEQKNMDESAKKEIFSK